MESNENNIYQLPENTDVSLKKMVYGLIFFFVIVIAIVATIIIYAQSLATYIPFSAEKRFVRPYEQAIQKWYPKQNNEDNDYIDRYLEDLVAKLQPALAIPEDFIIDVHYIDSGEVNAFATLGGHIFVFRGLLEVMPDENSLAMVVAHELAHIKHRDPIAAMGRGLAIQMLYGFITNDYSGGIDLVSLSGELGSSFFSREQEKNADLAALKGLDTHYGHVAGYDSFFRYIVEHIESEEEEVLKWLSSHPDTKDRIDYLANHVNDLELSEQTTTPLPDDIQERL